MHANACPRPPLLTHSRPDAHSRTHHYDARTAMPTHCHKHAMQMRCARTVIHTYYYTPTMPSRIARPTRYHTRTAQHTKYYTHAMRTHAMPIRCHKHSALHAHDDTHTMPAHYHTHTISHTHCNTHTRSATHTQSTATHTHALQHTHTHCNTHTV